MLDWLQLERRVLALSCSLKLTRNSARTNAIPGWLMVRPRLEHGGGGLAGPQSTTGKDMTTVN
jgi:hypothetical protein